MNKITDNERYMLIVWYKDGTRKYNFYPTMSAVYDELDMVYLDMKADRYKTVDMDTLEVVADVELA